MDEWMQIKKKNDFGRLNSTPLVG